MARGFGSTWGVNTNDYLVWPSYMDAQPKYSAAVWAYLEGNTGQGMRIIESSNRWFNWQRNVDAELGIYHYTTGTGGEWDFPDLTLTTIGKRWVHLGLTQVDLNAPLAYLNGEYTRVTVRTTPTGTLMAQTAVELRFGNRADLTKCWNGMLAEFALWDRVLSPTEMRRVYRYGNGAVPRGLRFYLPLTGNELRTITTYTTPNTITGTRQRPHPPLMRRRFVADTRRGAYERRGPLFDDWYMTGDTTDGWGRLQVGGSAPATTTLTTGWDVAGVSAGNYSRMATGVKRLPSTFSGTAQPASGPDNTLKDAWRTANTLTVDIPAGVWRFQLPLIATSTLREGATVRPRLRIWRSVNADGSSATEITAGAVTGSTVTALQSEAASISTATFEHAAQSWSGQYLFVQVALEVV